MNATTNAPATNAPVTVLVDPRRAARPGWYVGPADRDGVHVIGYATAKGDREVKVTADRFELVEVDAPVDEVPAAPVDDYGWPVDAGADAPAEPVEEAPAPAEAPAAEPVAPHTRDECEDLDGCTAEHVRARRGRKATGTAAGKAPKKAPLPEGYATPVDLARVLNARGLYQGNANGGVLTPQIVYRMIAQARDGAHPFPGQEVNGRFAVELEAGVKWWTDKDARIAARKEAIANRGKAAPAA